MKKPIYHLWYNNFSSQEKYEQVKNKMTRYGFRVVTYFDGAKEKDIRDGLKQLIKNHYT